VAVENALGQRTTNVLDARGQSVQTIDALGQVTYSFTDAVGGWYCYMPSSIGKDYQLSAEPLISQTLPPRCNGRPVFSPGRVEDICHIQHYWSLHRSGAVFAFGDGSVRYIPYLVETRIIRDPATRNGGEVISTLS
jgi:prepilin-type processing-associated H-X9-DG protein